MNRQRYAAQRDAVIRLLCDGWSLVLIDGFYFLFKGKETPIRANCNSAKSVLNSNEVKLRAYSVHGWVEDLR